MPRTLGSKPRKKKLSETGQVSDKLVNEVFNDPGHPLTPKLRERFGADQGTGVKVLSGSKSDFRKMLNTLQREGGLPGSFEAKIDALSKRTLQTSSTPKQKALAKHRAILLIGTLGFGAMAKEAEEGKHSIAKTLEGISNMTGLDPRRRRIAALGASAARKEGI